MRQAIVIGLGAFALGAAAPPPMTPHARTCGALRDAAAQLEKDHRYAAALADDDRRHSEAAIEARKDGPDGSILSGFANTVAEDARRSRQLAETVASDNAALALNLRTLISHECP